MNTVAGVVLGIVKDGKILLIKRNRKPFLGLWALPGGKIEYGEHIDEAALREAREETGLDVEFKGMRGVVSEHILSDGMVSDHFILFVCRLEPPDTNHTDSPEGELRWFSIEGVDSLRDSIVPSDYPMIKRIIIGKEGGCFRSVVRKDGEGYSLERFEQV